MANPCMICVFVPVADTAAAGNVEALIPRIDTALRKQLGAVPCLHFASLALLPPRPGESDGLPTLMFEWAIDAGIERSELAAALVTHAADTLKQLLDAANPNGPWNTGTSLHDYLRNNFDLAAGGFVGVRDRSRQQIVADDANFVLARNRFTQIKIDPRLDERASIVDTFMAALAPVPDAWNPSPRSIWRKPWMSRPIQAVSIAALLVMSPLTALGFGWPAVIAALILSALVLAAAAAGAVILLPALALGALAVLGAAQGYVLALVSVPPYSGVLSILAWSGVLGLALVVAFMAFASWLVWGASAPGWAAVAAAGGGMLQWLGQGVSRGVAALADYVREGSDVLSRIATRGTTRPNRFEWLPLMAMLIALTLIAVALASGGVAPLLVMALAGLAVILLALLAPLRWLAIALVVLWAAGAVVVWIDAVAPGWLRQIMEPSFARLPLLAVAGRVAAAAVLALVIAALLGLGVFLFSRAFARAPLIVGTVACAILVAIAWWTLPGTGAGMAPNAAVAQPRLFSTASVLLAPVLLFAALANAHYRRASKAMPAILMGWLAATCAGLYAPEVLAILLTAPPAVAQVIAGIVWECLGLACALLIYACARPVGGKRLLGVLGLIFLHGLVLAGAAQAGNGPPSRWILLAVLTGTLIAGTALALRAATLLWRGPARPGDAAVLAGSGAALLLALTTAALVLPPGVLTCLPTFLAPVADALAAVSTSAWAGLILALLPALLVAALLAAIVLAAPHFGAVALGVTTALLAGTAAIGVSLSALMAAAQLFGVAVAGHGTLAVTPLTAWITGTYNALQWSSVLAGTLLLAAPFAAVTLAAAGLVMMRGAGSLLEDVDDPANTGLKRSRQIHPSIRACEAALAYRMQHMISVTEVRRPVWLFAPLLRLILWTINSIGMIWSTEGSLGTAPGIHFGHWHVFDKGRRLVFASNFEVPFGGYLDDFINGTPGGINLIWQCTELRLRNAARADHPAGHPAVTYARSFPPTVFGYFGGCHNEQWFKSYARDSMIPHLFRYEAYSVTYADIERATRLRDGVCRVRVAAAKIPPERDHAADDQVLRALES